jgi:hypothetical protein
LLSAATVAVRSKFLHKNALKKLTNLLANKNQTVERLLIDKFQLIITESFYMRQVAIGYNARHGALQVFLLYANKFTLSNVDEVSSILRTSTKTNLPHSVNFHYVFPSKILFR